MGKGRLLAYRTSRVLRGRLPDDSRLVRSGCPHEFVYAGALGNSERAQCRLCKRWFTVWPGSVHYRAVVAARDGGVTISMVRKLTNCP